MNFRKEPKRTASSVCIAFYTLDSFQIYFLIMISEGFLEGKQTNKENKEKQNKTKQNRLTEEKKLLQVRISTVKELK